MRLFNLLFIALLFGCCFSVVTLKAFSALSDQEPGGGRRELQAYNKLRGSAKGPTLASTKTNNDELCDHEAQEEGEQWLNKVKNELYDEISPIASKIAGELNTPFIVLGSWPAKLIADARRRSGFTAPALVANDIDIFYPHGIQDAAEPEAIFSTLNYHKAVLADGTEVTVNTVGTNGYRLDNVLDRNDIGATGVAIAIHRDGEGKLMLQYNVSCKYWRFLLVDHVLRPAHEWKADAKVLVRIAWKAFQMNLDYDISSIDPTKGLLPNNIIEKIEGMRDWPHNPLRKLNLELRRAHGANAYELVKKDKR